MSGWEERVYSPVAPSFGNPATPVAERLKSRAGRRGELDKNKKVAYAERKLLALVTECKKRKKLGKLVASPGFFVANPPT